jgi:ATP-dependent Clp protease adapter protein ClpS
VKLLTAEPRSLTADRLDAMGLEPLPLMLYDAHGRAQDEPLPEGSGPVNVVVHNDPYTSRDIAADVLHTALGLTREQAEQWMLAIHRDGRAAFHYDEWSAGRAIAEAARRRARERGAPLGLTLERG